VGPDTVTVSSVYRAGGKSYLRVFEHAGRDADLAIRSPEGEPIAKRVDLRLRPLESETGVRAYGIATLELDG
jgi:hypothetical protein